MIRERKEVVSVKSIKLMLLGITVTLFGVSANLLAGLTGAPTFQNGIYELLGVLCPVLGVIFSIFGFVRKDQ